MFAGVASLLVMVVVRCPGAHRRWRPIAPWWCRKLLLVARWCTEGFQKGVAAHLLVNEVGGSLHCNCSHLPFLFLSPGLLPFNGKTKNSMRQDDPSPWKRAHPEGWLDGYEDELAVNSDFSNFASDTISSCISNWMTKELNETCLNFMTLPQKLAGWPGITLYGWYQRTVVDFTDVEWILWWSKDK